MSIFPFFLSPEFCAANRVIELWRNDAAICFGLIEPEQVEVIQRLQRAVLVLNKKCPGHSDIQVQFRQISQAQFDLQLSRLLGGEKNTSLGNDNLPVVVGNVESSADTHLTLDAPAVHILQTVFCECLTRGATDAHFEWELHLVRVRIRIQGQLEELFTLDKEQADRVVVRIKLLAGMNVLEKRRPQDGSFQLDNSQGVVRVSAMPTIMGESVVLRFLAEVRQWTLETLGFTEPQLKTMQNIASLQNGLVLVCGATGSGKSTTLSVLLQKMDIQHKKIISAEDPVEYRLEGITQIQSRDELDRGFEEILRRLFRQDPDVIMIGEIRDELTAQIAIRAALTGHLVFATLHTSSAEGAFHRLIDLGVKPFLLTAVLKTVVFQELHSLSDESGQAKKVLHSKVLSYADVQEISPQRQRRKPQNVKFVG